MPISISSRGALILSDPDRDFWAFIHKTFSDQFGAFNQWDPRWKTRGQYDPLLLDCPWEVTWSSISNCFLVVHLENTNRPWKYLEDVKIERVEKVLTKGGIVLQDSMEEISEYLLS